MTKCGLVTMLSMHAIMLLRLFMHGDTMTQVRKCQIFYHILFIFFNLSLECLCFVIL
jgi:hypothetical protein